MTKPNRGTHVLPPLFPYMSYNYTSIFLSHNTYLSIVWYHMTGPDACTEELMGGKPVYAGFELGVLQSLVQYFHGLAEPLISTKLFDLLMAVNSEWSGWCLYNTCRQPGFNR